MSTLRWWLGAPFAALAGALALAALACGHLAAVIAGGYAPRVEPADLGDSTQPDAWADEMRASWLAGGPSA